MMNLLLSIFLEANTDNEDSDIFNSSAGDKADECDEPGAEIAEPVFFDDGHFKRMGTLIAILGVQQTGDELRTLALKPTVLLKSKKPKVIENPNNLLCTMNPTCVINTAYMRDHFVPCLRLQLQQPNASAIVILDSASAHISPLVLSALRLAGFRYLVPPGGFTIFVQSIDTVLAALYRTTHHRLYMSHMEGKKTTYGCSTKPVCGCMLEGLLPKRPNCVSLFSLCLHGSRLKGRILHQVLQSQNLRLHQDN